MRSDIAPVDGGSLGGDRAIDRLLELIEQREVASLRWGYVDGTLSYSEASELAAIALAEAGLSAGAEELLEQLIERRLLFEFAQADGTYRLRSRFAEGVRLLSRSRQLFPQRSWQASPNLISDYRVDVRPRQVPRRDIPVEEAIAMLGLQVGGLDGKLASAVLRHDGKAMRLSRFQVESAQRILQSDARDRGVVISAGTGSGKTLAFYFPALIAISPWLDPDTHWTKALAIYPRRELLKDQFCEAYQMARRVDGVLKANGLRPLIIGTYFGLTPQRPQADVIERGGWRKTRGGYLCPFLVCPKCGAPLFWKEQDIARGKEQLVCRNAPRHVTVTEEQVTLTRQSAREHPPDIVFTTAEMVHQRLSDTWHRSILGVHPDGRKRARIVLLDEIHTYEGTTGAQTALALRRWRHAIGSPVRFVGLSATLQEACRFFAELTGVREERVAEVSPRPEDLEPVSAAYQVILRGDPVSRTSLLSASIQSAFLLARLLDPRDGERSQRRFGHRVFVFTDDLDVTNRLFHDLRDAEGYDIFGHPDPRRDPLAALRRADPSDPHARNAAGQSWRACEEIGWDLTRRLHVGRTTSQDEGVDPNSNIVVATSALEVGFDDPLVGAVLQHKSPRRLASFVQRKGRAGRTLSMRPWAVTVLSDYGRDRLTYQSYDQLFDPALPPQRLPVRNRYILRMQAVFAFIDWLAVLAQAAGHWGWWWRTLNGPTNYPREQSKQEWVQGVLKQLLRGERDLRDHLHAHLKHALQVSGHEVASLLWEPPRSLMLEVIPTLARRLATGWEAASPGLAGATYDLMAQQGVHPLPDFIPASLFSELNLPEVTLVLPPATERHEERVEVMPIVRALNQLAPGRVTRRFAVEHGGLNHWVPVPLESGRYDLPISAFVEQREYVAQVPAKIDGEVEMLACYRPVVARMDRVTEDHVRSTSNAELQWLSEIIPSDGPLAFPVVQRRGWGQFVRSIDFYLHAFRSSVTVRRFAAEVRATIRMPHASEEITVQTVFRSEMAHPCAVGYEQDVDGMVVHAQLPDAATLVGRANGSESLRVWRAMYFRDRVLTEPLPGIEANRFQRDWMYQIYLSALIAQASHRGASLQDARDRLREMDFEAAFGEVMRTLFRIDEGVDVDSQEDNGRIRRLEHDLRGLLAQPAVLDCLHALAQEIWNPQAELWGRWLARRAHETLGEAVMSACLAIAPRYAAIENLLLDLHRNVTQMETVDADIEIWVSESTPGGTGVIEAIAETFAADQRSLFTALDAALAPSDLELASLNLDSFIRLLGDDREVAAATANVRRCHDHAQRASARADLLQLLAHRGLGVHHAFAVALEHRLLREGMDAVGDAILAELTERWVELERRLGVAIDLRVFSYVAIADSALGPRLASWLSRLSGGQLGSADMVGVLAGILWPRPAEIKGRTLVSYSPFRERGQTEPELVRDLLLRDGRVRVQFESPSWREKLRSALRKVGRAQLIAARGDQKALQEEMLRLIATPIDVDYLQFYPVIEQASSDDKTITLTVILREVAAA